MTADPDVPWDLVAQVRRSGRKSQIVYQLDIGPACASELAEDMGIETATVSNYLRELKNMDPPVVECITPSQPHHRLYTLTEDGETVRDHI
jgi:DNA-binding HxlR family transcriptional regulator